MLGHDHRAGLAPVPAVSHAIAAVDPIHVTNARALKAHCDERQRPAAKVDGSCRHDDVMNGHFIWGGGSSGKRMRRFRAQAGGLFDLGNVCSVL